MNWFFYSAFLLFYFFLGLLNYSDSDTLSFTHSYKHFIDRSAFYLPFTHINTPMDASETNSGLVFSMPTWISQGLNH